MPENTATVGTSEIVGGLTVTVRDYVFTYKDDYDMVDLEKLSTVEDKYGRQEVNRMEVAYAGIIYLLESVIGPDGQPITINFNQLRELLRSFKSSEFTKLCKTMTDIKLASEDKKKELETSDTATQ